MNYDDVARLAPSFGLLIFFVLFALIVVYALWPANREKFKRAAAAPLASEDDDG